MDLLHRRDRYNAGSQSLPPGWQSDSANLAVFFATIHRMRKYEHDRLQLTKALSSGMSFRVGAYNDTETNALVAVKRIHEMQQRPLISHSIPWTVLQEMKISVWPPFLEHPNITRTLGYQSHLSGSGSFILGLVLEYSEIGSLEAYLTGNQISYEGKRALSIDIASGLECLHRSHVIHGDLKPSNILLFPRPMVNATCPFMAKLVDFGSAIIEDTYSENVRVTDERVPYLGTPLWVPPIVRKQYHIVPFEDMPSCDAFSFGLILWSIYKGRIYYEANWRPIGQTDQGYLDEIGVSGIKRHFDNFILQVAGEIPIEELMVLKGAFYNSVAEAESKEHEDTSSFRTPSRHDLDAMFSLITGVKRILLRDISHLREGSGVLHDEPLWQPFEIGSVEFEGSGHVSWILQVQYYHDLLDTIQHRHISQYKKGNAAMELAACSAIGFGCKKSIEDTLGHLLMAATFRDMVAQLTIHRLYSAHNKASPILDSDMLPVSSVPESETSEGEITDREQVGTSYLSMGLPWVPGEEASGHDIMDTEGEEAEERSEGSGEMDTDSDSVDPDVFFHFSEAIWTYFNESRRDPRQYYCWHLRKTPEVMRPDTDEHFTIEGQVIYGMDDPKFLEVMEAKRLAGESIVSIDDRDAEENSLLHRTVILRRTDLLEKLLGLGWDANSADSAGRTLLHVACRWGNMKAVETLVASEAKANIADQGGELPLHWLWMFEESEQNRVCSLLLTRGGAAIDASMKEHWVYRESWNFLEIFGTALHAAVAARSPKSAEVLLDHGADINHRPFGSIMSAVELAVELHLPEIVQLLIDRGANLKDDINGGWMIHGSEFNNAAINVIQILLNAARQQQLSVDEEDSTEITALEVALSEGDEETYIPEAFLQCGIEFGKIALDMAIVSCSSNEENACKVELVIRNSSPGLFDWASAFQAAVELGALEAIRMLVDHRGDGIIDSYNERLETPLHWAVKAGIGSIVKYLINKNAKCSNLDRDGIPPTGYALRSKSEELATILLNAGAELKIKEGPYQGCSILTFALSATLKGSRSMIGFLLSADLDNDEPRRFPALHELDILNSSDQIEGNTILHRAAASGDQESVFALLSAGAAIDMQNKAGRSPLQEAEEARRQHSGSQQPAVADLDEVIMLLRSMTVGR